MTDTVPSTNRWRWVFGLAVILTAAGLFYTEELWRGKAAWESCKRTMKAKGISFDWADYIPAPVPEDQNIFGVPEMRRWFVGRGPTELSKKMTYPDTEYPRSTNSLDRQSPRLVVADIAIELPGGPAATGSNVLHWGDPEAPAQALRLVKEAVGPLGFHPGGSGRVLFTARLLDDIHPAQITLQCQTAPTVDELTHFLPKIGAITDTTAEQSLALEARDGGYRASMLAPDSTEAYLKWINQLDPEFSLIHAAVQRPYVRMRGDYDAPETIPIPNFICARAFAQTLSAASECHLLEKNPDAALGNLTLINDVCRIFTNRPITLVGAMINVAVRNQYAEEIARGLRWHAWREPQLAALEEQLKGINLVSPVHESFHQEPVAGCDNLQNMPVDRMFDMLFAIPNQDSAWDKFKRRCEARLVPRGWIYQNMVLTAQRASQVDAWMDPISESVSPKQIDADFSAMSDLLRVGRPYTFLAAGFIPNFTKAGQRLAVTQTKVRQAMIACALERYQLAHGDYPEKLDALVPQFIDAIPVDVVGGQAPHYRRTGDGAYVLYSIGWSGQDGGGVAKPKNEGDWVWPETD